MEDLPAGVRIPPRFFRGREEDLPDGRERIEENTIFNKMISKTVIPSVVACQPKL